MNLWDRLFRRQQRDEELDEEVQAHLQMAAQDRMDVSPGRILKLNVPFHYLRSLKRMVS